MHPDINFPLDFITLRFCTSKAEANSGNAQVRLISSLSPASRPKPNGLLIAINPEPSISLNIIFLLRCSASNVLELNFPSFRYIEALIVFFSPSFVVFFVFDWEHIEKFDIILNLEIVEHVNNVNLYIKSCHKLLKKNGLMFTATLNRSFISYIKAIIGAEYILRWLPIGTHDWNKFIKPEELEKFLADEKFSTLNKERSFELLLLRHLAFDNFSQYNFYIGP